MTTLGTDALTLGHTAISLIAIVVGFLLVFAMLGGKASRTLIQGFLLFTLLVSVTGFFFHQAGRQPTPAQSVGAVSLALLIVALFALYGRGLAGPWRWIFVVTALMAQWLDVFVLIIQLFLKVPALHAVAPGIPPGGAVFGAVQGAALIFFLVSGFLSVQRFHPRAM
jgi:hypothetical protein